MTTHNSSTPTQAVTFIHLRQRNNGIAMPCGGYTIAVKKRSDGQFSIAICQCNSRQRYDAKLGEKVALSRINRGQFMVQDLATLEATLHTLHDKLSTGTLVRLHTPELDIYRQHKEAA